MKNLASKAVLLAAVALAGSASPSMADIRYYSSSNPMTAWQDGEAQAQMYGRFFVENASYLRNNTNQRDPRPGGDSVYEETYYTYFEICTSTDTAPSWCADSVDTGPKTDSDTWYWQYDHDALHSKADEGRMATHICEDHGMWSKDPCSQDAIGTLSY